MGIIATVEGKAFAKRLPLLKPVLLGKLQAACLVQSVVAGDDEEAARRAPGWREAYFLVVLVDKVLAAAPKCLLISEDDEGMQNEKARPLSSSRSYCCVHLHSCESSNLSHGEHLRVAPKR
jgi:hypothetical protein